MAGRRPSDASEPEVVIDLTRQALPERPPVPGAQWDEVHGRWEVWDDTAQGWMIVGDATGARIAPLDEVPLVPPLLAHELQQAEELDRPDLHVIDLDRMPAPSEPVPGAQWNEVVGRWERWDEAAGAWVAAVAEAPGSRRTP